MSEYVFWQTCSRTHTIDNVAWVAHSEAQHGGGFTNVVEREIHFCYSRNELPMEDMEKNGYIDFASSTVRL